MKTPGQVSKEGQLLLITHPIAGHIGPAHVFDLTDGGIAWVDRAWNDPYPGGGQPLHAIQPATFEWQDWASSPTWVANDAPEGEVIIRINDEGLPLDPVYDGTRDGARKVLEEILAPMLGFTILPDK